MSGKIATFNLPSRSVFTVSRKKRIGKIRREM